MRFKCLLILPLVVASLRAASVDDLTFSLIGGAEYRVSDCNQQASGSLDIPSTYSGLPVTSIRSNAFQGCSSLTTIMIPDSVTYIGEQAFFACTALTSVTIPDSVTYIGHNAFFGCDNLSSGFVPESEDANDIGLEAGEFLNNAMFELIAERLLQDDDFVARLLELIPQGPAGETGPQGIQGDTGPQGPPGLDSSAIQTLRASEPHVEASQDGTFNVQYRIQSSKDLNNWNEETVLNAKMDPLNSNKQFLRLTVE